ncbi:MATE efflux family protein [Segatella baroniae F0067]|uniref:Multidrug-efflux transporter n=1 Tax=Segatella baroniae F0067 TaxID=1115809 RepID=U2QCF7_9BACT|nr:MATE family efflux transporter [Segatella baroniae]ERK38978.1 MATE efflux family protein [Segatella baroniae F0067]
MFGNKRNEALMASIRNGLPMTQREKLNLIVGLSIPSILAQITNVMMFFIDASMVGHLGAEASASIGLVESTTWLLGNVMGASAMGFSVMVAHFIGANDFVKARQVLRHAFVCGLVFASALALMGVAVHASLPFWLGGKADIAPAASNYFLVISLCLPFMLLFHLSCDMLKSAGNMHVPSVMSVVLCVLDVVYNYFFIYLLGLGVMGAAIGTALAYVTVSLPATWITVRKNKILTLQQDTEPFRWVWDYVRNAVKISLPMAVQSVLMSGAQIVSTRIVAPLGNIAIASNSFAITAESLCYMPGYGIGDAATTLVGQTFGAGRKSLCKNFAYLSVALGMIVMAFMGAVMYIFAPEMIGVLSPVPAIRELGTTVLRIEAFAEPFFAASIVAYSVCVGAGDTLRPAVINLVSMWGVRLTLAAWLAKDYGLRGVWTAMAIELTFRGLMFLVRLFRGEWLSKIKSVE